MNHLKNAWAFILGCIILIQFIPFCACSSSAPNQNQEICAEFQSSPLNISVYQSSVVFFQIDLIFSFSSVKNYSLKLVVFNLENQTIFTDPITSMSINITSGNSEIEFTIPLLWTITAGNYSFALLIQEINPANGLGITYGSILNIQIFMGPFISLIFFIIFLIILTILLISQDSLNSLNILNYDKISYFQKKISLLFYNKNPKDSKNFRLRIRCPACYKRIQEGSAFCSYCGYHLRLFERNANFE